MEREIIALNGADDTVTETETVTETVMETMAVTVAEPLAALGTEQNVRLDLSEKYPQDQPVTTLDARDLQSLFEAAYEWLAHNYEMVNRLNVFPVPDGDTGTNMLLTIKSAWANIGSRQGATVGDVAEAAAEGAHHGSRGNSGVILGQILLGFSQSLREKATLTTHDLAQALREAAEAAYSAVPAPVEGTILTVAREIGIAAEAASHRTRDIRDMLAHIVAAADESVRRTPELLPVLKQAGVVDSGGKGLFIVFEGMHRALTGQYVPVRGSESPAVEERFEQRERKGHRPLPAIEWGFDVQFLIERPNKSVDVIATDIAAMGDCPLVEGDEHLVKVHIHLFDPGVAISYGVATGFITDVVVENMDDMAQAMRQRAEQAAAEDDIMALGEADSFLDEAVIGVVAVTPGPGFADIFGHLGAQGLVQGGQSMNPSVAELTDAVSRLPMRHVIVLPNNSNILMAAQQASKIVAKGERGQTLHIVPTRTVPQGIAALTAYDPALEDVDTMVKQMTAHMNDVATGEVTQAVRSAEVDGIAVRQGDIIGLDNGKLVSCGSSLTEVSMDLLTKMNAADSALITIYFGDFVAKAAAQDFAETVRGEYPEQDVELAFGGQPHYHYILSVE